MITLGLGSNLGNRNSTLTQALFLLQNRNLFKLTSISPIYESNALLPNGAPQEWNIPFLNLVISGDSDLDPIRFFHEIKNIEKDLGRKKTDRWAPRPIDIDILTWNEEAIQNETITIPHPEIKNRPFVLLPLADVKPTWIDQRNRALLQWGEKIPFSTKRNFRQRLGPEIVGIVNITPDSFSDGGRYIDPELAINHCLDLIDHGATVLDLGAESTRPGAAHVSQEEEWQRLEPVLSELIPKVKNLASISIDSKNPKTILKSLEMGVSIANDVTGFEQEEMRDVVKNSDCKCIVMHSLGVPPSREKTIPLDEDPVAYLLEWSKNKIKFLEKNGIQKSRIILDPGIGFGKTADQSLNILSRTEEFMQLGVEVLMGHSRKSFFNLFTENPFSKRDIFTVAASVEMADKKVNYLRVHDVKAHQEALITQFALQSKFIPS